jgi:signal recognition particle GTPase
MTREFTLADFMGQMRQVKKLGPMSKIIERIPGMRETMEQARMGEADIENALTRMQAIYDSMTVGERSEPEIVGHERRRRIARGAGVETMDVNQFLGDFQRSREMMRAIGRTGVVGRVPMHRVSDSPSVLGLVTGSRTVRDPSYVHRPHWWRMRLLILLIVALVVGFVCSRIIRL